MSGMLFTPTNTPTMYVGGVYYKHLCQLYNSEVYITEDSNGKRSCYESQWCQNHASLDVGRK